MKSPKRKRISPSLTKTAQEKDWKKTDEQVAQDVKDLQELRDGRDIYSMPLYDQKAFGIHRGRAARQLGIPPQGFPMAKGRPSPLRQYNILKEGENGLASYKTIVSCFT